MKCAPENCPALSWTNMTEAERKTHRKQEAERLYRQGFSMEAIAALFDVAAMTISRDLTEFSHDVKTPPRESKRGRKGEGRPKGRKSKPRQTDNKEDAIVALHEKGMTSPEIAGELGIEGRAVRHVLEREQLKREAKADPDIDRSELSLSAQQKLDSAIRQHTRKLEREFHQRVLDEVKKRIDQIVLPSWKERIDEAQRLYRHRRGAMDKTTFNKIRRALHPDSRQSISDKVLAEAFDTFMSLEKFLLDEKESPTEIGNLPASWDEWEKAKRQATAERRAKRSGGNALRPR